MTNRKPGYLDRAIRQGWDWVSGISNHNTVDDECCPDFSCCRSTMFEQNKSVRLKRMLKFEQEHKK